MKKRLTLLLLLTTAWPLLALGEAHSLSSLRQAVHDFSLAEIQNLGDSDTEVRVTVGSLDTRLHLEKCDQPPEMFLPPGALTKNRLTVGVRCASPKPWKLYVPTRVERISAVSVATRHIPRGKVISSEDIRVIRKNINQFSNGFISKPESIIGRISRQSIQRGATIRPLQLRAASVVAKGERVRILARGNGLSIQMAGKALTDGALGERIRVRNVSSKRTIEAEVIRPGVVQVRL